MHQDSLYRVMANAPLGITTGIGFSKQAQSLRAVALVFVGRLRRMGWRDPSANNSVQAVAMP